jgi:hypothetical protein
MSGNHFRDPPSGEEPLEPPEPAIVYMPLHFLFGIVQSPHWELGKGQETGKWNDIFVAGLTRKELDVRLDVPLDALLTVNFVNINPFGAYLGSEFLRDLVIHQIIELPNLPFVTFVPMPLCNAQ